jgi:hypothetical protein
MSPLPQGIGKRSKVVSFAHLWLMREGEGVEPISTTAKKWGLLQYSWSMVFSTAVLV